MRTFPAAAAEAGQSLSNGLEGFSGISFFKYKFEYINLLWDFSVAVMWNEKQFVYLILYVTFTEGSFLN